VRRRTGRLAALLGAALLVAGCGAGSEVRDFVDATYDEQSVAGDTATYLSGDGVFPTAATIARGAAPIAQATDAGAQYLRYDEDIVIVSPAGATSTVRVEDLDGAYRSGQYAYLGPGFDPGSPAGDIDDEDAK
jgi:hypothetical protein